MMKEGDVILTPVPQADGAMCCGKSIKKLLKTLGDYLVRLG